MIEFEVRSYFKTQEERTTMAGVFSTGGHFDQKLIDSVAQGHATNSINDKHLAKCQMCAKRVENAKQNFYLLEASQPPNKAAGTAR